MQNLKKLLFLFTSHERNRIGTLIVMAIIMALLDMLGVASILPFMAVLTNSNLIETNYLLNSMFKYSNKFGVENNYEFLFVLGAIVFLLLISALKFKAFTIYVQTKFIFMCEYNIGKRLIEGYLHQPYSWFLSRNSADLGKNILTEVSEVIGVSLSRLIELIANSILTIALISLIVAVDPKLSIIVGTSLITAYSLIFYFVRKFLNVSGEKRYKNNQSRFIAINEAFGAIKEIKVGGLEKTYIKNFSNFAQVFAATKASSQLIAKLPRFFLEVIAFGGILLIILYSISQTGSLNDSLPVISLYVFAGYRLMPALQQIYFSTVQLTFNKNSLDKLYYDFKRLKSLNEIKKSNEKGLAFNKSITLKHICYNYPNTSKQVLKDINLTIPVKSIVGFIGSTGSGKTTIVDIILGLLKPQEGTLEVDGKVILEQHTRNWQQSIGYVPQSIYLSDDTIEANIAFGIEPEKINKEKVKKVSKIAELHKFVADELPKQYQTKVGDRGIRLSGGQRQRIGIARALYKSPKVLILDEATSALDTQTEKLVMEAINNLDEDLTIIIIAHRLNTLNNCDIIFKIENGSLKKILNYEELNNIVSQDPKPRGIN